MSRFCRFLWCIGAGVAVCSTALADIPGDGDGDTDVDFGDFVLLTDCQLGPDVAVTSLCGESFDYEFDADVDMADFAAFQACFSGENVPGSADCASHLAHIENGCLHIIGTAADTTMRLILQSGAPSILEIDIGADGFADFAFNRSAFDCIHVNARGGDDLVVIDESRGVFTDTEATTIDGGPGHDTFFGGSGGEVFIGGGGDDLALMGGGDDTFVWNPGDDTDFVEGEGGSDVVQVNGDDGGEAFTATANGTRVRFDRISPSPFSLDIGTSETLSLSAGGGDDSFSATGNLAALIQITASGGPGDDTLLGSNGADVLIGGDDNDFVDGQQGNDLILLGAGVDTFQWDPGDGSDTVEGQDGQDVMLFNGSGANETYTVSANGSRLRFTRNVGNIVMDVAGVEQVDLFPLGGTDNVVSNSLAGTDVRQVNVDFRSVSGVGDGLVDTVTIVGSSGPEAYHVSADAGFTMVDLAADVRAKGYEGGDHIFINGVGDDVVHVNGSGGADSMTLTANGALMRVDATGFSTGVDVSGALAVVMNGLGGPDTISCTGNLAGFFIPITLDGGPGDDIILGSNAAELIIGGDGDDFVDGNQGNDAAFLGAGDDTFNWDPGDGSDTVEGQADHDVLVFNGSNANEIFEVSANGQRLRFARNIGDILMDLGGIEQIDMKALGGTDAVNASSLIGTGVSQVNIDLGATGGVADVQADSVVIVGTAGADVFDVVASGGFTMVNLGADIRVKGYEFGDQLVFNGGGGDVVNVNGSDGPDTMTVVANGTQARVDVTGYSAGLGLSGAASIVLRGQGGSDLISCVGNLAGLFIPITLDGGPGDDTLLGSNAADVLIGGDDDDFLDGNQGNDVMLGGSGNDTINWDPGDGSDVVEGQAGQDVMVFNGSNTNEAFNFSANGGRLLFTRNVGNITMDVAGVERFDLKALGGTDALTVNDLNATGVFLVNIDLGAVGGVGDAQPDTITVNGTNGPDAIHVSANAGAVDVAGLAAQVHITHSEPANDTLIVNGLGGVDALTSGPGVTALIMLIVNQ